MYASLWFLEYTEFFNYYCYLFSGHFHHRPKKQCPLTRLFPFFFPAAQALINPTSTPFWIHYTRNSYNKWALCAWTVSLWCFLQVHACCNCNYFNFLFVGMSVCGFVYVYVGAQGRPDKAARSLELGVQAAVSHLVGVMWLNSDPLQETYVLTAGAYSQALKPHF